LLYVSDAGDDLDVRTAIIDLTEAYDILVLEEEGAGALDVAGLSGAFVDATFGGTYEFGEGPCHHNWVAPPGGSARVRVAGFDLAGNFSGWSRWIDVELPERAGCGCAADSDAGPAWTLLTALGLLGLRRRRDRSPI
jgi:MYXO-CTERM domain-containing protein